MKEHELQGQVVSYMRLNGWIVMCLDVMVALASMKGARRFAFINHYKKIGYTVGQPDLVCVRAGQAIFIECKSKTGKMRKEQKAMQEILGASYYVIDSLESLQQFGRRRV